MFFKNVDERLADLGFVKVCDDKFIVSYERYNDEYKYTHVLDICHKRSGRHIIQSYDKESATADGCNNVGLTYLETKLALKKMKQKGWNRVKN